MAAVSVTKKPHIAVSKLTLKREKQNSALTHKMKATWTVPKALVNSKSHARATNLRIKWRLDIENMSKKKDPYDVKKDHNESHTSSEINLNDFSADNKKKKITRESFYPFTDKLLKGVAVSVQPYNSQGDCTKKAASATHEFKKPNAPTVSNISFNTETGVLSTTITQAADGKHKERWNTAYHWYVERYTAANKKKLKTITDVSGGIKHSDTSYSPKHDASGYQGMGYDDYIHMVVNARSRGYAGASTKTTKEYYLSYPAKVEITSVSVPNKTSDEKCNVYIKVGSTDQHPVDQVKLEYLANVEYATEAAIPADASWTVTDIVDNKNCSALSVPVADIMPTRGNHTWVRVMSWHANEAILYRYSNCVEVKDLYEKAPTATDDKIKILSATAKEDGESIAVHLGWNANGLDDSTGTELTWSDEDDSWESTEPPSEFNFEWSDGRYPPTGTIQYHDSALITIKNLEKDKKYYIRARRYLEGDSGTTYSKYDKTFCMTGETPESVVASASRWISKGSPLPVSWTYSGYASQKEWKIVSTDWNQYVLTRDAAVVTGKQYYTRSGAGTAASPYVYNLVANPKTASIASYYEQSKTNGNIIENGESNVGYAQISAEKLEAYAQDGVLSYTVQVSTGGGFVVSEPHTVTIVENPVISAVVPATLTVQPLTFSVTCTEMANLIVLVTSQGVSGQTPAGSVIQANGDTVYSDEITPVWVPTHAVMSLTSDVAIDASKTYYVTDDNGTTIVDGVAYEVVGTPDVSDIGTYYEMSDAVDNDTFTANVQLPTGLSFADTATYAVSVTAHDTDTDLKSNTVENDVVVNWAHQAPNPDDFVTLTPIDEVDDEGNRTRAVRIELTPPDDCHKLTADTEVVEGKTYYTRTGAGTEESPYVFTAVEPESGDNPSSEGWYELTDDVYDIYRMDVGNPSLIGRDFPLEHTVVDQYAPFGDGDLYYRFAIRTPDGDADFADISYVAPCENMRIDWGGGQLELPYGVSYGDSYTKDVMIRQHLDGSSDGYWNLNVDRKSSLRSDIIKIMQPQDVERARALARYAGPAFVRLPDGTAYEASVQVTDLSKKNDAVVSIAIDANEVGLTQEFMLPVPDTLDEVQ